MHAIDDVIDEGHWGYESILGVLVGACEVYSHPWYVEHGVRLQLPILVATSTWVDSCTWEKAPELWKRQWADVLRHAGNDVIMAVAIICGGYEQARQFSGPWWAMCYVNHADRYGEPSECCCHDNDDDDDDF